MPAVTAAAIASAYGLGALVGDPVYAARGEQGRIWRLATRSGSWAVKELLLPVGEAGAARDVEFQLAAAAAGIPLPLPRRMGDGRVVLPAAEAGLASSVRVYRWADLAGGPAVTGAEIGRVTARLHQVPGADPGPAGAWFSAPAGEPAWRALLADARRGRAPWAAALGRWLPELAAVVSDLAADVAPQAAAAAHAAYRAAGGPARLGSPADFATAVAVQGHLLQFYSRRALDRDESAENRARSGKRLDHMLRQPLTMSRIDHLLGLLTR